MLPSEESIDFRYGRCSDFHSCDLTYLSENGVALQRGQHDLQVIDSETAVLRNRPPEFADGARRDRCDLENRAVIPVMMVGDAPDLVEELGKSGGRHRR